MSRIILFISILFFMISCNIDNKEDGRLANHESQNIVNSFILNDDKIREFNKYVDEMNFDNSVIYAIEFFVKDKYGNSNTLDTFIDISFNYCDRDTEGYKGVLLINNNVVAIFDKNNIGADFYDKKYIYYVPYEKLKCRNEKYIISTLLKLTNGKFNESWL